MAVFDRLSPSAQLRPLMEELKRVRKEQKQLAKTQESIVESLRQMAKAGGRGENTVNRRLDRLEQGIAALQRQLAIEPELVPYPERLVAQRFRLLSQNEEDGITLALLEAAGIGPRRFVELGCGDNGGNSGMLAAELGFSGLMVDGAETNVAACRLQFPQATVRQAWIERETIDDLVRDAGFAGEVDVLSVDIDGNDLHIWDALTSVEPRIAIAEYNSLMGPSESWTIPYDPGFVMRQVEGADGGYFGASLTALTRSFAKRGMRLVTTDRRGVNAFFVREDLAPDIPTVEPERVFRVLDKHQRMMDAGYDLAALCDELGLTLETYA